MVYGDILLYRQLFPGKDTTQKSFEERKKELKKKLERTHNFGKKQRKAAKLLQNYFWSKVLRKERLHL